MKMIKPEFMNTLTQKMMKLIKGKQPINNSSTSQSFTNFVNTLFSSTTQSNYYYNSLINYLNS